MRNYIISVSSVLVLLSLTGRSNADSCVRICEEEFKGTLDKGTSDKDTSEHSNMCKVLCADGKISPSDLSELDDDDMRDFPEESLKKLNVLYHARTYFINQLHQVENDLEGIEETLYDGTFNAPLKFIKLLGHHIVLLKNQLEVRESMLSLSPVPEAKKGLKTDIEEYKEAFQRKLQENEVNILLAIELIDEQIKEVVGNFEEYESELPLEDKQDYLELLLQHIQLQGSFKYICQELMVLTPHEKDGYQKKIDQAKNSMQETQGRIDQTVEDILNHIESTKLEKMSEVKKALHNIDLEYEGEVTPELIEHHISLLYKNIELLEHLKDTLQDPIFVRSSSIRESLKNNLNDIDKLKKILEGQIAQKKKYQDFLKKEAGQYEALTNEINKEEERFDRLFENFISIVPSDLHDVPREDLEKLGNEAAEAQRVQEKLVVMYKEMLDLPFFSSENEEGEVDTKRLGLSSSPVSRIGFEGRINSLQGAGLEILYRQKYILSLLGSYKALSAYFPEAHQDTFIQLSEQEIKLNRKAKETVNTLSDLVNQEAYTQSHLKKIIENVQEYIDSTQQVKEILQQMQALNPSQVMSIYLKVDVQDFESILIEEKNKKDFYKKILDAMMKDTEETTPAQSEKVTQKITHFVEKQKQGVKSKISKYVDKLKSAKKSKVQPIE